MLLGYGRRCASALARDLTSSMSANADVTAPYIWCVYYSMCNSTNCSVCNFKWIQCSLLAQFVTWHLSAACSLVLDWLATLQSNWEAVKALALDTTTELHQQPTSPLHDTQSAAQVSSPHHLFLPCTLSRRRHIVASTSGPGINHGVCAMQLTLPHSTCSLAHLLP